MILLLAKDAVHAFLTFHLLGVELLEKPIVLGQLTIGLLDSKP